MTDEIAGLMAAVREYRDVNNKPQYQGQFADSVAAIAAVEAEARKLLASRDAEIERLMVNKVLEWNSAALKDDPDAGDDFNSTFVAFAHNFVTQAQRAALAEKEEKP